VQVNPTPLALRITLATDARSYGRTTYIGAMTRIGVRFMRVGSAIKELCR